jgi:hypothetical protein
VSAANALRKMELEVRNKAYVLVYCIVWNSMLSSDVLFRLSSRLNEGHADTGEARLRAQALYSDK